MDEVLELLLDLNATDEQFESPTLFCSGRQGTASYDPDQPGTDLTPLFETIVNYIPAPEADTDQPFQMLVSAIDYNLMTTIPGLYAIGEANFSDHGACLLYTSRYFDVDATWVRLTLFAPLLLLILVEVLPVSYTHLRSCCRMAIRWVMNACRCWRSPSSARSSSPED